MPSSLPFDAVLFDFGHTLFDTPSTIEFLVAEAASHGVTVDPAEAASTWSAIRDRSRTPEEMGKGRDLSLDQHRAVWMALLAPFDAWAPGLAEAAYLHETSPAGWIPYPDTRPTIDTLVAAGVQLGVVSDTGWDIRPVFEHHRLAAPFGAWVLSGEHGATKPSARLFLHACAELGVDPSRALMVGDNHRTDGGAADAGLTALVLPLPPPGAAARGLDAVLRLVLG